MKQSGKTRVLDVVEFLVRAPWRITLLLTGYSDRWQRNLRRTITQGFYIGDVLVAAAAPRASESTGAARNAR